MTLLAIRRSVKLDGVESPDLARLRCIFEGLGPIGPGDWVELAAHVRPRHVARGDFLQRAGAPVVDATYILEGVVREYYTTDDGREHVKGFVREGRFAMAYADRILGRPSAIWIQALRDTRLLWFPVAVFEELRQKNLAWEVINRKLLEELYVRKEKRELEFLTLDAAERYRRLLTDQPGIEALVTQAQLASYLGITPIALSRIRSRRRVSG